MPLGKITLSFLKTSALSVNLNSAPILFFVVSIVVLTFWEKSRLVEKNKNMYTISRQYYVYEISQILSTDLATRVV